MRYLSKLGYQIGDDGIDTYGVNHNDFTINDELRYQTARIDRENQLIRGYNNMGMKDNYPLYTTNFWGNSSENNYGFGNSNIQEAISNHSGINQSPLPVLNLNQNPMQPNVPNSVENNLSTDGLNQSNDLWEKIKNHIENFANKTEAAALGFASGISLGNFDEVMGAASNMLTNNNYFNARDAVRELQMQHKNNNKSIYGGAEIAGATIANKFVKSKYYPVIAGIGYADKSSDIPVETIKNGITSRFTKGIQKVPFLSQNYRNLGQNGISWYLLDESDKEK